MQPPTPIEIRKPLYRIVRSGTWDEGHLWLSQHDDGWQIAFISGDSQWDRVYSTHREALDTFNNQL